MRFAKSASLLPLLLFTGCSAKAQSFGPHDPRSPLQLTRVIPLPDVKGRIDHMALNGDATHIYIAENGNGTVDDLNLDTGRVVGRIGGLHEPQGVAWLPARQEIAVTSADGLVTFYRASDLKEVAVLNLGADADNVRIDRRNGHLIVGYGSGGLAVIDPAKHRVISQVQLPAHPEAFEEVGSRVFVNIPNAHEIAVVDLDKGQAQSPLGTGVRFANFPMAADVAESRTAVAFRTPPTLIEIDARSGTTIFSAPACGDADDLYLRSTQFIVVCGSGKVELIDTSAKHAAVSISTGAGARTGLLDAAEKHLFVAVPARGKPASLWELSFR